MSLRSIAIASRGLRGMASKPPVPPSRFGSPPNPSNQPNQPKKSPEASQMSAIIKVLTEKLQKAREDKLAAAAAAATAAGKDPASVKAAQAAPAAAAAGRLSIGAQMLNELKDFSYNPGAFAAKRSEAAERPPVVFPSTGDLNILNAPALEDEVDFKSLERLGIFSERGEAASNSGLSSQEDTANRGLMWPEETFESVNAMNFHLHFGHFKQVDGEIVPNRIDNAPYVWPLTTPHTLPTRHDITDLQRPIKEHLEFKHLYADTKGTLYKFLHAAAITLSQNGTWSPKDKEQGIKFLRSTMVAAAKTRKEQLEIQAREKQQRLAIESGDLAAIAAAKNAPPKKSRKQMF